MDEPGELPRVVYDLMIGFEIPQLCAKIGMDETAYIRQFEKMCDNCSVAMSHQIKILVSKTHNLGIVLHTSTREAEADRSL